MTSAIRSVLRIALCALPVFLLCAPSVSADDWPHYGRSLTGTRYSPAAQITPENVKELQPAWTYRTGDLLGPDSPPQNLPAFEATPLKVGDTLYLCTPQNVVIAIDAETGAERWRYDAKPVVKRTYLLVCRGVSHYEAPAPREVCQARILTGTMDGRLLALDAASGQPCSDFGDGGTVDLKADLGPVEPGFYAVTSPPLIANGVAVVGSLVLDNQNVSVPSGVVRAFDPLTGEKLWAFDTGRADSNPVLAEGETYTRGSPNAWTVFSADEALGLVYLPTGNRSTDYFGANRSPIEEENAAAIVALDIRTGEKRWSFQTVHHDLWDYDVPAQPVLIDFDTPEGRVPALVQSTKRGELFVLDRRTGVPVSRVEERPVPQGAAAGDYVAPTQPYSVDMPSFEGEPLTEASMWGVTPFDLLWCRTKFKSLRYEGPFTPPSVQGSIHFPNNMGAFNWGSVSIDEERQILIANTSHVPSIVQLIPRDKIAEAEKKGTRIYNLQLGSPYAAIQVPFLSPLGIPCSAPPWGLLTAIDLKTKTVLWQRPLGTTKDRAPLGIALPLGMPNIGGSLVTKSGLIFIGAALDNYLRAFDIRTGRELWKARLPAGAQATPMTFTSEKDGRQYVVVAAGGHKHLGSTLGDYVMAFALPRAP